MHTTTAPLPISRMLAPGPGTAGAAGHRGWRDTAAVVALVFLWLAATAWVRPLMLPDEGRYVGVAWEMLRSGDWLTPTLNGLPFFHKPPLFYWITAASMSAFGTHDWTARMAPLLGATLGAVSLYLFIRRWSGQRAARLTLVALLAQPLFYVGAQFANLDMLVAGCITATILLAAHAALCVGQRIPYRNALAAAYAMAALGVLAKGLIGIVLPALVVTVWLVVSGRWRVLRALLWWPGLLLFLLVAAPWFAAMQARFPDFLDYFFVVQQFKRFAAGGFNNVQPFWFYPAILVVFSLPWLRWLWRLFAAGDPEHDEQRQVRWLMVLWIVLVMAFFSIPQSKLVGYILPAIPPLAALMALGFLQPGEPSGRSRRWWQASAAAMIALSLAAIVGLGLFPQKNSLRELALALRAQRAPDEAVFMLGKYYYDVPVYAGLRHPVGVVDEWQAADVQARDNGRKELADAAAFAPALAASVLIAPGSLPAALCGARTGWLIGPASASARYPFLVAANVAYAADDAMLWRVDGCAAPATSQPSPRPAPGSAPLPPSAGRSATAPVPGAR